MSRVATPTTAPVLALPVLSAAVPLTVASTTQAQANASLCRFLIDAGAVREDDLPQAEPDPLVSSAKELLTSLCQCAKPVFPWSLEFALEHPVNALTSFTHSCSPNSCQS